MTAWRQVIDLSIGDAEVAKLIRSCGRERNWRAVLNGPVYCWPIAKIHLSLPSPELWDCIIRRFSGVLSGLWPTDRGARRSSAAGQRA
jgi:hypothetical protein